MYSTVLCVRVFAGTAVLQPHPLPSSHYCWQNSGPCSLLTWSVWFLFFFSFYTLGMNLLNLLLLFARLSPSSFFFSFCDSSSSLFLLYQTSSFCQIQWMLSVLLRPITTLGCVAVCTWLDLVQALCIQSQPLWVHVCNCAIVYRKYGFETDISSLWLLTNFWPHLLQWPLSLRENNVIKMFYLEPSTSQSLVLSVLTGCCSLY